MNSTYFSHLGGGKYNVKSSIVIGYNEYPDNAIALDPRTIINEWNETSLKTMSYREVYAGLQVYCLEDRKTRICRWVPSVGQYTANDCIWDVIYTSDEDAWVDITDMEVETPVELLNDRIKEAELKEYQFLISANKKYWGISNYEVKDVNYEQIIHDIVLRDKHIMAGEYSFNGEKTLDVSVYNADEVIKSTNGKLYIFVPSIKRETYKIKVSSAVYSFAENINLDLKQTLNLKVFNTSTNNLDPYLFDLYVIDKEITDEIITKLINDPETTIKVTFTKIEDGKE